MSKQKAMVFLICIAIVCVLVFAGFKLYNNGMSWIDRLNAEQVDTDRQEQVTLNFMYYSNFPKEIFSRFTEKYPGIKVEAEQFGRQHYPDVQQVRLSSGENLDLMEVMENDYLNFAENGYLEELTGRGYLKNYRQDALDGLFPLKTGGKLYAIPYKSSILGIWYNKILFNKYNVEVPDSYSSFIEACEKFKSNGVSPMVIGGKDEWRSSDIYYLRIGNAIKNDLGLLQKLSTGELKWTDAEVLKSFEEVDSFMQKDYLLKDSINLTNHQAFNEFARGRTAMFLTDDGSLNMIEPGIEKVCDLGVFPIPYNDSDDIRFVPGSRAGFRIGVYKGSDHKKEAELLLEYISQPEIAQYFVNETKSNSTIKSVNYAEVKYNELWEPLRLGPFLAPMASALDHDLNKELNRQTRELMLGLKTPYGLLKGLEEKTRINLQN